MELQPPLDNGVIAHYLGCASIVGFGESTHGTHEFFGTKAEVFKTLVSVHGFNTIFIEAIDDTCDTINQHLQTGKGNLEDAVNRLFYVYRVQELLDLFKWLRQHNDEFPVRCVGIDERKYVEDYANYDFDKYNLRDKRMALVVQRYISDNPRTKVMIWAHDDHVASFINKPEWAEHRHIPMGEHLRKWFGYNYINVAQLFGSGYFNAALIEESGSFDNSKLVLNYARKPSKYFWENKLAKVLSEPTFLAAPDFDGLIGCSEVLYKRALGWGVKRSIMHDNGNVSYVDISKAFDAVTFFPHATASHLLR